MAKRSGIPKSIKALAKLAQAQGWRIEPTNKGHAKWFPPHDGDIIVTSGTASDRYAINQHLRLMKKAGFKL